MEVIIYFGAFFCVIVTIGNIIRFIVLRIRDNGILAHIDQYRKDTVSEILESRKGLSDKEKEIRNNTIIYTVGILALLYLFNYYFKFIK